MGVVDDDEEVRRSIRRRLRRRRLKLATDVDWEINGEVCVVYADFIPQKGDKCICLKKGAWRTACPIHGRICVAVYPRAVYEIVEPSRWCYVRPEDRIPAD